MSLTSNATFFLIESSEKKKKSKKSAVNALYGERPTSIATIDSHIKLVFDTDENKKNNFKVFSTNYRGDHLIYVSDGFRLKILNMFNGDLLTEIDGAHYKGISAIYFIINSSTEGQVYRVLNFIENELHSKEPNPETLKHYFRVLLNCIKLITISNKEFIRLWKFHNLQAKLLHQSNHPGGSLAGKSVFHYGKRKKQDFLLTAGKNSNKLIVYKLD